MKKNIVLFPFTKEFFDGQSLQVFMAVFMNGSKPIGHVLFNSGAPGHQIFTTVPTEQPGQLHPIPEGDYSLGGLEWSSPDKDWAELFQEILSPFWVTVYRRRAIGIHLDGNRLTSPGSAGCLVPISLTEARRFIYFWETFGPFENLHVCHYLGYTKVPRSIKVPAYNYMYLLQKGIRK